jgi:hypothetical protein
MPPEPAVSYVCDRLSIVFVLWFHLLHVSLCVNLYECVCGENNYSMRCGDDAVCWACTVKCENDNNNVPAS